MNERERCVLVDLSPISKGLPICNPLTSNAGLAAAHQSPADGEFDENDVLVAVSLPVVVFHASVHRQAPLRVDTVRPCDRAGQWFGSGPNPDRGGASKQPAAGGRKRRSRALRARSCQPVMPVFRTKTRSGDSDVWYTCVRIDFVPDAS
jgi:hypothetical protein